MTTKKALFRITDCQGKFLKFVRVLCSDGNIDDCYDKALKRAGYSFSYCDDCGDDTYNVSFYGWCDAAGNFDCRNCVGCTNCIHCLNCTDSEGLYRCSGCTDCSASDNCHDCSDCVGCSGMVSRENLFDNQPA